MDTPTRAEGFTDPPRHPEGTPEYAAYAAELKAELAKFAAGEAPYAYEHLAYNPTTDRYETGGDEIEFADEGE